MLFNLDAKFKEVRSTLKDLQSSPEFLKSDAVNFCFVLQDLAASKLLNLLLLDFDFNKKTVKFAIDKDQKVLEALSVFTAQGDYHNPIPLMIYLPESKRTNVLVLDNFYLEENVVAMTPIVEDVSSKFYLTFSFNYDRARMEFIGADVTE